MLQLFRTTFLTTAIIFSGATALAAPTTTPQTKDIAIGVNEVYIPGGLVANSDILVVASGLFPNGCYRWKGATVHHSDDFNHEVQAYATVSQGMCIMVLVPFTKEIPLGKLVKGEHTLKFLNGDGTYLLKTMTIQ